MANLRPDPTVPRGLCADDQGDTIYRMELQTTGGVRTFITGNEMSDVNRCTPNQGRPDDLAPADRAAIAVIVQLGATVKKIGDGDIASDPVSRVAGAPIRLFVFRDGAGCGALQPDPVVWPAGTISLRAMAPTLVEGSGTPLYVARVIEGANADVVASACDSGYALLAEPTDTSTCQMPLSFAATEGGRTYQVGCKAVVLNP